MVIILIRRKRGWTMEQHIAIRKVAHDAVLNYLRDNGWGAGGRLAADLGLSPAIISEIKRNPDRNTSMETCAKIIEHLRHEIGPDTLAAIETSINEDSPVFDIHRSIIKKFKNQELAKDINAKLLELERYNSEYLNKVNDFIDGMLAIARPEKTGTDGPG
jgi:DNA-binding XRE family transcriptional regulator